MDTDTTAKPATASEISSSISRLRSRCEERLEAVRRATAAEHQNSIPAWGETEPDFEARRGRAVNERDYQERLADDLLITVGQELKRLTRDLGSARGLGLSATEWQAAGTFTALAESLIAQATTETALGELRGALLSGDRPRMAAFLAAAERRTTPATVDGKTPMANPSAEHELRAVMGEIRSALRDKSLDPAREKLKTLVGAAGDLSGTVFKAREARKPLQTVNGEPKVAWPKERDPLAR